MPCIDDDPRELYGLLFSVCDGFNRSHGWNVIGLDFDVQNDDATYSGSLVFPERSLNLIDFHYRDLVPDDFDWWTLEDWNLPDRVANAVRERQNLQARREAQRRWRLGLSPLPYVSSDYGC